MCVMMSNVCVQCVYLQVYNKSQQEVLCQPLSELGDEPHRKHW